MPTDARKDVARERLDAFLAKRPPRPQTLERDIIDMLDFAAESLAAHEQKVGELVSVAKDISGAGLIVEALRAAKYDHTAKAFDHDLSRLRAALKAMEEQQ